MAFVAEVKARAGLDITAFQRALTSMVASTGKAGTDINRKLQRSFGAGDAFKGILQGIGIGSVQQIADAVTRPFEVAADRAKQMESFTGSMADIATKEIAALNGRNAEIRITDNHIKSITVEMGIQQRLIDELKDSPFTYLNPTAMQQLLAAEESLNKMKVDQAQMISDQKVRLALDKRKSEDILFESDTQDRIAKIERKRGSEREKELVRLRKINRDISEAYKRGYGLTAVSELWAQGNQSINRLRAIDSNARKQIQETLVSSGQAAAGSVMRSGRGRTEAERIAERGAKFQNLAEYSAMRGNKADAARYAAAAVRDFRTVGRRKADGSSMVRKEDADLLKSEILSASQSLQNAARELEPKKIR